MVGNSVQEFFADVSNHWGSYILALNIIGGTTMALLQTAKDLLPIRNRFQRDRLENWFKEASERASEKFANTKVCGEVAEKDLIGLAANGDRKAFYDLQIEDLCGLYNAAIQIVLEDPIKHADLLMTTASRAEFDDIKSLQAPIPSPLTQPYLDSRNRLLHQCQRAIGAFQMSCQFRWKWIMQIASLVVSIALAWIALSFNMPVKGSVVSVVFSALLAGFLAPVAKDLLAVLQKARGE